MVRMPGCCLPSCLCCQYVGQHLRLFGTRAVLPLACVPLDPVSHLHFLCPPTSNPLVHANAHSHVLQEVASTAGSEQQLGGGLPLGGGAAPSLLDEQVAAAEA